jgi:hypothetical protein
MRALVPLLLLSTALLAQTPPPDLKISAAVRADVIEKTAVMIDTRYVDPAKGHNIAAALRAAAAHGAFDNANSALALVPLVNRVFTPFGDLHLRFGYDARPDSSDPDAPMTPAQLAEDRRLSGREGYGIHGVQRLEGNIGLLTMASFQEPAYAGQAFAAAMTLLSSTDALLIDLRGCNGGAPEMVAYMVSFFLDGDPVLLTEIYNRVTDSHKQFWTAAYVPAPRYTGREVYILTDKRTWSAAEGFAEHMQARKLATLVGEPTRGGAHLGDWRRVHPNFAVFVPHARVVSVKKDWDGKGVQPDIAVAPAQALREAHVRALRHLRSGAKDDDTRGFLDDALASLEPAH